ncbi:hypothetical protein [Arthrobacter sp. MAHUQ-56]
MPAQDPNELSPQELVLHLKEAYGYTWKEMGERLGRSEKMVRKVAAGQSRGESYRQALTDLFNHGEITHVPPRRRDKEGHIVPVRAKAGAQQKTVVPQETGGTFTDLPKRGKYIPSTVTDLAEGGRQYHVEMPKTARAKGRKAAVEDLRQRLLTISRSQARQDKRIKLQAVYQVDGIGRVMDIGSKSGYHASDILNDVKKDYGGDMTAWLAAQSRERYTNLDVAVSPIVSVTMTVFTATRSKSERKQRDAAGTRRRRRR